MKFFLVKLVLDKCCKIDADGLMNGIAYLPEELDGIALWVLYFKPKRSHAVIMTMANVLLNKNIQEMTESEAQLFINVHRSNEYGRNPDGKVVKIDSPKIIVKHFVRDWKVKKLEKGANYKKRNRKYLSLEERAIRTVGCDEKNRKQFQMTKIQYDEFLAVKVDRGFRGIA